MSRSDDGTVHAGGGVVWRAGAAGEVEVLLVHRPRYDDWSFPKGKRDPGESDEGCAVREVEEETGVRAALGPELPSVAYTDRKGRPKVVRYWAMAVVEDLGFEPGDEVDERRWCTLGAAADRLSYAHDVDLLGAFAGLADRR
jgi:8-oxo-dGTP pyrophosphatase MutT (NUDIX family)